MREVTEYRRLLEAGHSVSQSVSKVEDKSNQSHIDDDRPR
jgi:hypothetical protein